MKRFRLIAAAIATAGALVAILLTWEITHAQSPDNAVKQAAEPVDAIKAFTPQNEPAGSNKLLKPELKAGQAHKNRSQLPPVPADPPTSMSNDGWVSQIQSATRYPSNSAFDDATAKQSKDSTPKQTLKVFSLQYTPALNLQQTLGVLFTKATIVAEAGSNSLLIRAEKAEAEEIETLVKRLDVVAVAVPQGPIATPSAPPTYHAPSLQPSPFVSFGSTDTLPRQPARMATAESRANELAVEYRELSKNALDAAEDQRPKLDELKKRLEQSVTAAFDERQKSQTAELEVLRQRLNQIETSIKTREKNREAIINRRVEELINPDVKWDAGATLRPGAVSEKPASTESPDNLVTEQYPVVIQREIDTPEGKKFVYETEMREREVVKRPFEGERPQPSIERVPLPAIETPQQPLRSSGSSVELPKLQPNDVVAIQGTWLPEASLLAGKFDEELLKVVFTKNAVAFHSDEPGVGRALYNLDPSKAPKWIDFSNLDGKSYQGIYQLDGDELKICFPADSKDERPDSFDVTQEPAKMNLIILTREKG